MALVCSLIIILVSSALTTGAYLVGVEAERRRRAAMEEVVRQQMQRSREMYLSNQ